MGSPSRQWRVSWASSRPKNDERGSVRKRRQRAHALRRARRETLRPRQSRRARRPRRRRRRGWRRLNRQRTARAPPRRVFRRRPIARRRPPAPPRAARLRTQNKESDFLQGADQLHPLCSHPVCPRLKEQHVKHAVSSHGFMEHAAQALGDVNPEQLKLHTSEPSGKVTA